MKAMVCKRYGSPDVLKQADVEMPRLKNDEVMVKVHASSVNAADVDQIRGVFMVRMGAPIRPRHRIPGSDIAGKIEAIGRDVSRFSPGEEVYADLTESGFGAFAEYVAVPESSLVLKPSNLSFEEAASMPSAGGVALINLQGKKPIQPGQKVLINGAGGGMGTLAVQIAKADGAEVTGVDTAEKLDMLRSIGADHVFDYLTQDVTKNEQSFDLIIDLACFRSINDFRPILNPDGVFLLVGGSLKSTLQAALAMGRRKVEDSREMGILAKYPKAKELMLLKDLAESGKIVPVIDRHYRLEEISDALAYLASGKAKGKVVISVTPIDRGSNGRNRASDQFQ